MNTFSKDKVTALILAGGKGRRLGGIDKGKVNFQNKLLIEHVIDAIQPQVSTIIINANRNIDDYTLYGYDVVSDRLTGFQGPLAGFATGLHATTTPYMVTVPCDGPWLAANLVSRLYEAMITQEAELAVAHDGQRMQPVYCLLPVSLLPSLESFLTEGGRKIDQWYTHHKMALADFSNNPLSFSNINTQQDHHRLEQEGIVA